MKQKFLTIFLISPLIFSCSSNNTNSIVESENPEEIVFDHLEFQDAKTRFQLDEAFSVNNEMKVYAHYSDGSKYLIDKDSYLLDSSAFNNSYEGTYDITVSVPQLNVSGSYKVTVKPLTKFNVLWIGNSHGDDSVRWSHEVAKDLGLDFMVANLYIGGCTLEMHYENLLNGNKAYEFRTYSNGVWQTTKNVSIQEAISFKGIKWDFAVIHQQGSNSGISSSFSILDPYLTLLEESLADYTKIVYMATWAYSQYYCEEGDLMDVNFDGSQEKMYKEQQQTYKNIIAKEERIYKIIPTGTAIQNARSSFMGDGLNRDLSHLTYDFGRYIAALNFVYTLSGKDISAIHYAPDGVSEKQIQLAIESVENAGKNKFEVTQSVYKE